MICLEKKKNKFVTGQQYFLNIISKKTQNFKYPETKKNKDTPLSNNEIISLYGTKWNPVIEKWISDIRNQTMRSRIGILSSIGMFEDTAKLHILAHAIQHTV